MGRDFNKFRRHVEECLEEREAKRQWIKEARRIIYRNLNVTDADWLKYGDRPPSEWLCDFAFERELEEFAALDVEDWDWYPEDDWEDIDEQVHAPMDYDWDTFDPDEEEFGGLVYPGEHVRDARRHQLGRLAEYGRTK